MTFKNNHEFGQTTLCEERSFSLSEKLLHVKLDYMLLQLGSKHTSYVSMSGPGFCDKMT